MAKRTSSKAETAKNRPPPPQPPPPHAPDEAQAAKAQPNGATDGYRLNDPATFGRNMAQVAAKSQKLVGDFVRRQSEGLGQAPLDPLNIGGAFFALFREMAAHPDRFVAAQFALWSDYATLWQRSAQRLMGTAVEPVVVPATGDRRFRDKDWEENQVFDFIKQSYLLTANWLQRTVGEAEGLDPKARARASFYAKQFADAIAPTNFVLT